jgi:hypothetical protein
VEVSLYPLFSPQSLIAEGTANYGIELVFPGDEKLRFAKEVLLPLAGMDTTGITTYFKALELKSKLNFVRNDVARGLMDGTMKTEVAQNWLIRFGLYNNESAKKSIDFMPETIRLIFLRLIETLYFQLVFPAIQLHVVERGLWLFAEK